MLVCDRWTSPHRWISTVASAVLLSTWTRGIVARRRCTRARTSRSNTASPAGSWMPSKNPAAVSSDVYPRGDHRRAPRPGILFCRRACVAFPATRTSATRPILEGPFKSCTVSLIRPTPAVRRDTTSRTRRTGSRVPTSDGARDRFALCPIRKGE